MSYDFALGRPCEHEVLFESVELDAFAKDTIRFPRPTSASGSVRVYLNGVEVPRSGLYSTPSITSVRSEPFRLKNMISDLVTIRIGNEAYRTVQTISGSNVKASELAQDFSKKIPELQFKSVNGKLFVGSRTKGKYSGFTFLDPRWNDRNSSLPDTSRVVSFLNEVGINPGRVATGILICPPWDVIKDNESYLDDELVISFESPVLSQNPSMQISYHTSVGNCRRCQGSRYEFDYGIMGGTYETVDGADLLLQEFDKFLFTKAGSHWKWNWLGSSITDRIGTKAQTAFGSARSLLSMDVSQSFRIYQDIKRQQDSLLFQQVQDSEYPVSLGDLSVEFDPDDPTVALVTASLITRSQEPIILRRVISDQSNYQLATGGDSVIRLRG